MTEPLDGRSYVYFPPVVNGIDYLRSVVDHLAGEPQPRDLKYGVLHLQAATEVLLKARLLQEHWSLVFKDPGRADRARFESGDFESCGTAETISRLRNIIGIDLPKAAADEINQLAKSRNSLQHYGLVAPAPAVESRTAQILDFLQVFIDEHLLPGLSGEDAAHAHEGAHYIHARLGEMRALIKARMDRLRPELAPFAQQTVECPECGQPAVIVGSPRVSCRFCEGGSFDAVNFAQFYVGVGQGKEWEQGYEDIGSWPIMTCPRCAFDALVLEAQTVASPDSRTPLCFACGRLIHTDAA